MSKIFSSQHEINVKIIVIFYCCNSFLAASLKFGACFFVLQHISVKRSYVSGLNSHMLLGAPILDSEAVG